MGLMLLCVDGSDGARAAVGAAGTRLAGAALVLSVWQPEAQQNALQPVSELVGHLSGTFAEMDEIAEQLAAAHAEEGASIARAGGLEAEALVRRGRPWECIVAVAAEQRAATIVLGARGLGAIGAVLLGSVSNAVLHHAPCPVLVVPDGA